MMKADAEFCDCLRRTECKDKLTPWRNKNDIKAFSSECQLFSGNPRLSNFLVKTVFSGMKDKEIEAQHVVSEEECSLPPDLQ